METCQNFSTCSDLQERYVIEDWKVRTYNVYPSWVLVSEILMKANSLQISEIGENYEKCRIWYPPEGAVVEVIWQEKKKVLQIVEWCPSKGKPWKCRHIGHLSDLWREFFKTDLNPSR